VVAVSLQRVYRLVAVASGVFISAMLLVQLLEGYLPSDIGRLPVVGEYINNNVAAYCRCLFQQMLTDLNKFNVNNTLQLCTHYRRRKIADGF